MANILIAKYDLENAARMQSTLSAKGHCCIMAQDEKHVLKEVQTGLFDLMLLNVDHDEKDVDELLSVARIRGLSVILMSKPCGVNKRIRGLHMGAEDYLMHPIDHQELLARVDVVLRRKNASELALKAGDITVLSSSHRVFRGQEQISLSPKEYALLVFLMRNKNIVFTREQILTKIWGIQSDSDDPDADVSTRTVDMHIQRLRRKLGLQNVIHTVQKIGYRLDD